MLKIMLKKVICIICAVPLLAVLSLAPLRILAEEDGGYGQAGACAENGILDGEAGDGSAVREDMLSGPAGNAAAQEEAAGNGGSGEGETVDGMADGAGPGEGASEGADKVFGAGDAGTGALSYTEDDLYVMAHVLAGECQSYPDEEQLYVGSVVLNRRNHPSFPDTVRGVVFQKGQYTCTRDGNYYREPTGRNWENARRLLESGSVLPGHVIWQSGRRQGRGVYIRTRWHYYCY